MDIATPCPDVDVPAQEVGRSDDVRAPIVEKALRALLEDAERCEGVLPRADVDRIYVKRQLSVLECMQVEQGLHNHGVSISESEEDEDDEPGEFQSLDGRSTQYLTEQEERDCGRSIALARNLTPEDENKDPAFCQRIRDDAKCAVERLVRTNLRWIGKIVNQHRSVKHLDADDLRQEGVIGLMRATDLYDPEMGFRFKTYATWWIRQRITRAIGDMDRTIRLPIHVQEKMRKIRRAEQSLLAQNGRPPSVSALADYLGVERERLLRFLWYLNASSTAELDAPVSEDRFLIDLKKDDHATSPFEDMADGQLHERLNEVLRTLKPREERVIRLRFGLNGDADHTLEEIGQLFGVTRERIRQIEAKALIKLRHPTRSRVLEHFRTD